MTKSHARGGHRTAGRDFPPRRTSDRTYWLGLLMIGVFAVGLWYFVDPDRWALGLVGYLVIVGILVHVSALRAMRGRHLAGWSATLARLPLRAAGYGGKQGRPLEASRGSRRAAAAITLSAAAWAVAVGLLGWFLLGR